MNTRTKQKILFWCVLFLVIVYGVFMPALNRARADAARTNCANAMKEIASSYFMDEEAKNSNFPRQCPSAPDKKADPKYTYVFNPDITVNSPPTEIVAICPFHGNCLYKDTHVKCEPNGKELAEGLKEKREQSTQSD